MKLTAAGSTEHSNARQRTSITAHSASSLQPLLAALAIKEKTVPSVLIETRQQYSAEVESGIMEAVHSALREAFKIRPGDRNVRLLAHEPHRFECPPDREKPEFYTHISIDCFAGRSLEAKRLLYSTIVDNLAEFGIPKSHVKIMLREVTAENWGIRGGQAGCDVNLGFQVNV